MCTLLFAHGVHAGYPLVIAANRDEYYGRPTQPAGFWDDAPEVLAGRDLQAGGTWLGMTRQGRWAAVTNVREPSSSASVRADALSRGHLVSDYLRGAEPAQDYLAAVAGRGHRYNGFNLVAGDEHGVWYLSNRAEGVQLVAPGVHGVTNHLLDTPWPKVVRGRTLLTQALTATPDDSALDPRALPRALFDVLADQQRFADDELPDTGVGIERERVYAPIFVSSPGYGTCSSTVITVHKSGRVTFIERTTNPTLADRPTVEHVFSLRP